MRKRNTSYSRMPKFQLMACRSALLLLLVSAANIAQADVVEATYSITSSGFLDSGGGSPMPPASDTVSGTYTFTFNTAIVQQNEITPNFVAGLDITDSDGVVTDHDSSNSGVNVRVFGASNSANITIGGNFASVAFMVGISNDFRVIFEISTLDYTVNNILENLSYITTTDPFYTAANTTVQLVSVSTLPDTDNDSLLDSIDNCQLAANVSQRDTDGDNIGNACDPDFNQDCAIDFSDLGTMKANFFMSGDLDTDLDGNSFTDFGDLGILKALFFGAPGPSGLANLCNP